MLLKMQFVMFANNSEISLYFQLCTTTVKLPTSATLICWSKHHQVVYIWQAVMADIMKLISHLVFLRHPHHISFNSFFFCFCQNKLKPFFFQKKKNLFSDSALRLWNFNIACSRLLPAGEGDDRVGWQAKAWLVRVVPSSSRFLPLRAYGWRNCYPLALYQQSIYLYPQTEQDHTGLEIHVLVFCLSDYFIDLHWCIRIHEIWCWFVSCLYRWLF